MRCLPVLAALLWYSAACAENVAAQTQDQPVPIARQASAGGVAGIVGIVTDETGAGLDGVSVLAMGATVAVVRTDRGGHFHLSLAPGPYILRATRDGYISTFREAVQVRTDVPLTRHITMVRVEAADDVVLASFEPPVIEVAEPEPAGDRPVRALPSETVWRLRHLPRTVLRDYASSVWSDDDIDYSATTGGSRAAMALASLSRADFGGQVDFLTTGAVTATGDLPAGDWPRGVAYVVVGAPVGSHGEWSVRTSMAGGRAPAWTFIGEYASNTSRAHAFRAGVSYSAQTLAEPADRLSLAEIDTVRRVGGIHVSDQWTVHPSLQVDSSFSVGRYDYLTDPTLTSGRVLVRQRLLPRVAIVGLAASHKVAPGSDQFAPPSTSGVWLPPERTFSSLDPMGRLRPQHVQGYEIGTDTTLKSDRQGQSRLTLRVRRFAERTSNQIVTLFGLDAASQVGHYYVDSPGGVDLEGWLVGVSGRVASHVRATIDYSTTAAGWQRGDGSGRLGMASRSVVRSDIEHLHDVTASLDASVPSTSTSVMIAVRVNSGFSRSQTRMPGLGGRFAIEVRQLLPVQPLDGGELNLLFSARTLLHHVDDVGGYYDELLTVAPPVRLMSGLQMRF